MFCPRHSISIPTKTRPIINNLFAHKHKINESPKHTHTHHNLAYYTYIRALTRLSALLFGGGGGEGRRGKKSGETILGPQHTDLFRSLYYFDAAVCEKDKSCRFYMPPPSPKKTNKLCFHIHASLLCVYIQFSSFFLCVCQRKREKRLA